MLKCSDCGYKGVNLSPSYGDGTARCPRCNGVFEGILARNALYDDFSTVKEGNTLKKVNWGTGETPQDVVVEEVVSEMIIIRVDKRLIKFDSTTGVAVDDDKLEFLTFNI